MSKPTAEDQLAVLQDAVDYFGNEPGAIVKAHAEVVRLTEELKQERSSVEQLNEIQAQILGDLDRARALNAQLRAEVEVEREAHRRSRAELNPDLARFRG